MRRGERRGVRRGDERRERKGQWHYVSNWGHRKVKERGEEKEGDGIRKKGRRENRCRDGGER